MLVFANVYTVVVRMP